MTNDANLQTLTGHRGGSERMDTNADRCSRLPIMLGILAGTIGSPASLLPAGHPFLADLLLRLNKRVTEIHTGLQEHLASRLTYTQNI